MIWAAAEKTAIRHNSGVMTVIVLFLITDHAHLHHDISRPEPIRAFHQYRHRPSRLA
jgi:hypothetical protein